MVRYCVIGCCENSRRESVKKTCRDGRKLCFHRLPASQDITRKWMDFIISVNSARLSRSRNSIAICSEHFLPDLFSPSGKLNFNAVPSLVKSRSSDEGSSSQDEKTNMIIEHQNMYPSPIMLQPPILEEALAHPPLPTPSLSVRAPPKKFRFDQENVEKLLTPSKKDKNTRDEAASPHTPVQGRKKYIGDLKTEDFGTPCKASKYLFLVKRTVALCKTKIKNQKNTIRRLREKVQTLEDLVSHLKQKKYINDQAVSSIEVS